MADNDLNEAIEEVIDDAEVITVPIDDTLSNSGEAADAKAVGDALALKADKTEIQTAVKVNGQSADNQGNILVTGADTKMSSTDNTTIKAAIEAVDGKTAADIPVSSDPSAQTIAQALSSGATRTADMIAMSADDDTTVKAAIEGVGSDLSTLAGDVSTLASKTAADIKYQAGSNETIKQHVDAVDAGNVKSVNQNLPDNDGNVNLEIVPYAENLHSDEMEQVDDTFIERMTGGELGINGKDAWILRLCGNRVHTGYTAESITKTVTPIPRTAPAAITASVDKATFIAKAGTAGTYYFNYTTGWDEDPTEWGITVTNTPIDGDKITVTWDGEDDPVLSVDAAERIAPPEITATVDRDTWVSYVNTSGTYTFIYSTAWKLNGDTVNMATYGITVNNTPVAGDEIAIVYVKEIRGTITQATPTALTGTGWNLYQHANGYARVLKYSNVYGYLIGGTYTSIAWAETPTGNQTPITPDEDGLFDIPGDGYILVTGGASASTYILATWSDWEEGYDGDFQSYLESTVSLSSIMTSFFPYGLCKVGDIVDEINVNARQAISRITRMAYTDGNLATAKASGRAYEYDENYIYLERSTPSVSTIEISEAYEVDDHGMEFFTGSTIGVYAEILYGQNLKDKLRRDVVTIREQSFTSGQKSQARDNIGAASQVDLASTNQAIANVQNGLAYIVGNTNTTGNTLSVGQFVYVKGHSTITEGLRTVTASISANGNITTSNTSACSDGGLNALNETIANLKEMNFGDTYSTFGAAYNARQDRTFSVGLAAGSGGDAPDSSGTFDLSQFKYNSNSGVQFAYHPSKPPYMWQRQLTNGAWSGWMGIVAVTTLSLATAGTHTITFNSSSTGMMIINGNNNGLNAIVPFYATSSNNLRIQTGAITSVITFSVSNLVLTITSSDTSHGYEVSFIMFRGEAPKTYT